MVLVKYNPTTGKWETIGANADLLDGFHAGELGGNPNIAINPNFRVNQRGLSAYSAGGYTVDCWKSTRISVAVNDSSITLNASGVSSSAAGEFLEFLEIPYDQLAGKKITVSADFNGTVVSASGTVPVTKPTATTKIAYAVSGAWQFGLSWAASGRFYLRYVTTAAGTLDTSFCKLEIGGLATPFSPPIYADELARCQRYFVRIKNSTDKFVFFGTGYAYSATKGYATIPLAVPMRSPEACTLTLSGSLYAANAANIGAKAAEVTDASDVEMAEGCIAASLNFTSAAMTANAPIMLQFRDETSYIDISSEF